MSDEANQGLNELLSYVDDTGGGEKGQVQTDLDDKSPGQEFEEFATDQTASQGEEEEDEVAEAGAEDGGEEDTEVSAEGTPSEEETRLRAELAEIKRLLLEKKAAENQADPSAGTTTPEMPKIDPIISQIDLFKDYSFDDLVENEDTFKKWAGELVAKVQEVTQESVYRQIPQLIQSYTDQQIAVNSQAQQFYQNNPDLADHKAEVAKNANLIAQAEPGLDRESFFKRVADFSRSQLNLDANPDNTQGGVSPKTKKKPALNKRSSKASGRMSSQPELAGIEKEISEMLENIEG